MSTAAGGLGTNWFTWSARKVPFVFDSGYPYVHDVLTAMDRIQSQTRVWFCARGNEANYVLITNAGQSSFSDIGMANKGQQVANIQAGYKALHELGHTLGLIHEQNRTDRDTYITIDWANIVDPNLTSCLPANGVNGNAQFAVDPKCVLLTDYDEYSVMHYPAPATGWQGCPSDQQVWTMRWKASPDMPIGGGVSSGGWASWTGNDIAGVNKLYDSIPGWSRHQTIARTATDHKPALAAFQNRLYVIWNVQGTNEIWRTSSFDGSQWDALQVVPHVGTSTGPALAVFQAQLYMAWMGSGDQHIWWSSFDGSSWTAQQTVPNVGTTDSPAICSFQNRLYAAWKGSSDQHLWWSSFDGSNWAAQQTVANTGTTGGPTLAVFNDHLYLAWKGSSDQHIWWSSFDGSNWAAQQQVPTPGTTDSPALCPHRGKLYLAWKGSGDDSLWYADFDGSSNPWSGQAMIADYQTLHAPVLSEFNNNLYMGWPNLGAKGPVIGIGEYNA
jgi:hypothetical protein